MRHHSAMMRAALGSIAGGATYFPISTLRVEPYMAAITLPPAASVEGAVDYECC